MVTSTSGEPSSKSVHSPLRSINNTRTHTSCTRSSQVVAHPRTYLAQNCLTSVFKWELMNPTQQGCWHTAAKMTFNYSQCCPVLTNRVGYVHLEPTGASDERGSSQFSTASLRWRQKLEGLISIRSLSTTATTTTGATLKDCQKRGHRC